MKTKRELEYCLDRADFAGLLIKIDVLARSDNGQPAITVEELDRAIDEKYRDYLEGKCDILTRHPWFFDDSRGPLYGDKYLPEGSL